MEFYYNLPLWLSSVLVLGVTVGLAVGAHIGVRKLISKRVSNPSTELATALMGVVSAFIGIMLAFPGLAGLWRRRRGRGQRGGRLRRTLS
jgi:hypothetical protein